MQLSGVQLQASALIDFVCHTALWQVMTSDGSHRHRIAAKFSCRAGLMHQLPNCISGLDPILQARTCAPGGGGGGGGGLALTVPPPPPPLSPL